MNKSYNNSFLAPFPYIKRTSPSPLQTSFSSSSPVSPLQPKVDNFDIKNEKFDDILQYNVLTLLKKKIKKENLIVFNTYPYKVSSDLKKIFNKDDCFFKNKGKLNNDSNITKDVIERIILLRDISKCIIEPDWEIFQNAASIIQAHWRGYLKRKELINNYLEHPSQMKNIKFIKNYNYFNKKESKYITKNEFFSKINYLTKRKNIDNKSSLPSTNKNIIYNNQSIKTISNENNEQLKKAATIIQSGFRGHYIRHYYNKYQNSNIQATKIQALWRGYITRKKYELTISTNSLKKLCQQNTFLIENLYKLINPYVTPDNKLNLSVYEEKINYLNKQVAKLTQDSSKQANEYEKHINKLIKDRQKDKDEYQKYINNLKSEIEDMRRDIFAIKKELNLPTLAKVKKTMENNKDSQTMIKNYPFNGIIGNNNSNTGVMSNNGNNNGNTSVMSNNGSNNGNTGVMNNNGSNNGNTGVMNNNGNNNGNATVINNNSNNNGNSHIVNDHGNSIIINNNCDIINNNTQKRRSINGTNEQDPINNYFNKDNVNNNFIMKKQIIDKIIYYKNKVVNDKSHSMSCSKSLPQNQTSITDKKLCSPPLPMQNDNTNTKPHIQRSNSNKSNNYEEFKSNWMNNEQNTSLLEIFCDNNKTNNSTLNSVPSNNSNNSSNSSNNSYKSVQPQQQCSNEVYSNNSSNNKGINNNNNNNNNSNNNGSDHIKIKVSNNPMHKSNDKQNNISSQYSPQSISPPTRISSTSSSGPSISTSSSSNSKASHQNNNSRKSSITTNEQFQPNGKKNNTLSLNSNNNNNNENKIKLLKSNNLQNKLITAPSSNTQLPHESPNGNSLSMNKMPIQGSSSNHQNGNTHQSTVIPTVNNNKSNHKNSSSIVDNNTSSSPTNKHNNNTPIIARSNSSSKKQSNTIIKNQGQNTISNNISKPNNIIDKNMEKIPYDDQAGAKLPQSRNQ
ncbi:hypothetical protein BCR36DRAFT_404661, partial [Piromyces finnis]